MLRHGGKNNGFKKKSKYRKQGGTTADDFFRGVSFHVGEAGATLYAKNIERLGLYASTQFKNRSDVMKCLKSKKLVKPEMPF